MAGALAAPASECCIRSQPLVPYQFIWDVGVDPILIHRYFRYVINEFTAVGTLSLKMPGVDQISAIDRAATKINAEIRIAVMSADSILVRLADEYAKSPMKAYATCAFATVAQCG
ncbi:MAG: hypothetical protein KGO01_01270 [Burkholderiales bacterium]|nr:hypothetical protein [Burkholderiales bacterium]